MNRVGHTWSGRRGLVGALLGVALAVTVAAGPSTRPVEGPATRAATRAATRPATRLARLSTRAATRPTTRKAAIDLSAIATQSGSVSIALAQMAAEAAGDRIIPQVQADLPPLADEIGGQVDETNSLLASNPSLQVLDAQADNWQALSRELEDWAKRLTHRRDVLRQQTYMAPVDPRGQFTHTYGEGDAQYDVRYAEAPPGGLQVMEEPWVQSQEVAYFYANHAPTEDLKEQMRLDVETTDGVIRSIGETREKLTAQGIVAFGLKTQVDVQQAKVDKELQAVREARDQAWDRLFQRDGIPIWAVRGIGHGSSVAAQGQGSFHRQVADVRLYVYGHRRNLSLHVALIAVLAAVLIIVRRWIRHWAEADPSLNRAMLAFTAPIATAVVLSFVASVWIYPRAPRLFWAGLGASALVPTVYLLRRVVERRLFMVLDAMVVFYAVDQVRTVAASVPLLSRGLFLAEMLGGALVLWALMRAGDDRRPAGAFGWIVYGGVRVWLAAFVLCLLADAVGNVSLAELVGGAALNGGYLAVILYACTRILGGLTVILLRSRPLSLLNGVRRHQPLLLGRLTGLVDWVAAAFWLTGVLAMLSARPAVFAAVGWFWGLPVGYGSIHFTPSHVLVFALTVYVSFKVSRFVQFVLDEDVYGHMHLAGGSSYAINRIVHYVVVVVGIYVALAAANVPLAQFSLVVGALTVGLGFGLQNVVNNFVSGLILLFERPIKVGDLVQLSDTTGTVEYIGIRASIIRTPESSEVIVPNGNLLSNQLTNWTRTSHQRGLSIPMTLSADAEPARVMSLLVAVAAAHPLVVTTPPPQALLVKFGGDGFAYELRAWTHAAEQWGQIRSDLSVSLHAMLVREEIGIKA